MALSKIDWTEASLVALARDGLAGVAVEPLARRLGTTKGSFYWHFAHRAELIAATLELWEQRDTTEVINRIQALGDPHEQLAALGAGAYAAAARGNAHAAVVAAASDPRARKVLERVTRTRLAFLERLYAELGVATGQAGLQARLAYALYLGIGELRRADPDGARNGQELEDFLTSAVHLMMPPEAEPRSSAQGQGKPHG
ncbi:MAG: TetR/AcrR family transcriptional regulator [Acidimicrobiales bacterium]